MRHFELNQASGPGSGSSATTNVNCRRFLGRGMTRVAFFGFYGRGNFGDDLFGYLLQSISARAGVEPLIVGASLKRELTHAFHLPFCRALWMHPGIAGTTIRLLTYVAALFRARAVVFGGGSLFGENASLRFVKLIVSGARRLNKPVAALGVSVGPFVSLEHQQALSDVLRALPSIAVRDEASIIALKKATGSTAINLKDLAFSLPCIYTPKSVPRDRRTLIVSIHLAQYVDTVLGVLAEVDRRSLVSQVLFVSLDDESAAVTGDIARLFVPTNVSVGRFQYGDSIAEMTDLLASATCVITSKLHGAIVSFVYGVPFMLFCYQRKCAEFLIDNAVPGPLEPRPSLNVCIDHVVGLLTSERSQQQYEKAASHLDQFTGFVATIGGLLHTGLARRVVHADVESKSDAGEG
jgi:polysaccharide pyruvyl transferase WcaK-like protein